MKISYILSKVISMIYHVNFESKLEHVMSYDIKVQAVVHSVAYLRHS